MNDRTYTEMLSRLACSYHPAPEGMECGSCHFPVQKNEGMVVRFGFADCGEYAITCVCMTCITRAITTELVYRKTKESEKKKQRVLNWLFRLFNKWVMRIGGYDKKWRPMS